MDIVMVRKMLTIWSVMKYLFLTCTSLILGSCLYADGSVSSSAGNSSSCYQRGLPTSSQCMQSGFSAPAAIDIKGGWNTFVTASYLYYEAIQGGMDLGTPWVATYSGGSYGSGYTDNPFGASVLVQDFSYKSGFQVGLGWICPNDNWILSAEYSWMHGTTHTSSMAPNAEAASLNGLVIPQTGYWYTAGWLYDYQYGF